MSLFNKICQPTTTLDASHIRLAYMACLDHLNIHFTWEQDMCWKENGEFNAMTEVLVCRVETTIELKLALIRSTILAKLKTSCLRAIFT